MVLPSLTASYLLAIQVSQRNIAGQRPLYKHHSAKSPPLQRDEHLIRYG